MSETRPIQVVVAYDLSPSGEIALKRAIEVVARAPHHVLHVVTVLDAHRGIHKVTYDNAEAMQRTLRDHVGNAFNNRTTAAEIQFFIHCRIGKPVDEVLNLAREVGADLIFVGSHNKASIERMLLGSVSEQIVREAGCPVMVAAATVAARDRRGHDAVATRARLLAGSGNALRGCGVRAGRQHHDSYPSSR